MATAQPPVVGRAYLWISSEGYTTPAGEVVTPYSVAVNSRGRHVACVNTTGDDQSPEGYSMTVPVGDLFDIPQAEPALEVYKPGRKVVIINSTMSGRYFVESYNAKVLRHLGDNYYRVAIGGHSFDRFVDQAAQDDPAAFVSNLNARVGK
jgi:hypothetical protein